MPDPQDTRHEFRGSMPADTPGSHISVSMSMRDARVRVTRLENHVAAFVGDVSVLLTAEQWRYFIAAVEDVLAQEEPAPSSIVEQAVSA